jgi:DNA-binding MarR family transcriptional regulator
MADDRGDLLAALAPLTKALRGIEDSAAGRAGITMWQYAILSVVAVQPGLNQAQVADYLQYSRNRIIADLDLLERRKLLTRRPGADRRANQLRPTAAGVRLMCKVRADIHHQEDLLLAMLPAGQRKELHSAAQAVSRALRSPTPTGVFDTPAAGRPQGSAAAPTPGQA